MYNGGANPRPHSISDGAVEWEFKPGRYASTGFASPAVVNDFLVVAACTKGAEDQPWYDNSVILLQ